jgi:hypothetical protein
MHKTNLLILIAAKLKDAEFKILCVFGNRPLEAKA